MTFTPEQLAILRKMPVEERKRLADLELSRRDPQYRIERHRWIKDKAGKIRPLGKLKMAQRKTLAVLHYCRERKIPPRLIIAKSRKQGESTIIAVDCYEQTVGRQIDALILAHDREGVSKIFRIYQRLYQYDDLPDKPQPYKGKINLREMRFSEHDGHITVATARNIYAGTGETPQYLHLSEGSKWDRGAETKTALLQSIGDDPETTLIEESTFNGEEDCFLPTWRASYDNSKLEFIENKDFPFGLEVKFEVTNTRDWNGYIPLFISVLDDEDAKLAFITEDERARFEQTLDEDEKIYRDRYGASLESLNWLRRTLKLKCRNKKDVRMQEYPVTEAEAIRASGRPRFNIEALNRMPIEEGRTGRLEYSESWEKSVRWVPDPQGFLTVFRHPVPNHRYYVGCDPAEGSSLEEDAGVTDSGDDDRLDDSVIIVFDLDANHEQCATYQSKEPPEDLAVPCVMMGLYYNQAFVVVEANSAGYTTCIKVAEQYDNSLLYHRDDWDPQNSTHQRAVGNKTTTSNRNILISYIADALNQNDIILHDKRTVSEHKSFVYNKRGKPCAAFGKHDDHVSATWNARAGIFMARRVFETRRQMMDQRPKVYGVASGGLGPQQRQAWATRNSITGY